MKVYQYDDPDPDYDHDDQLEMFSKNEMRAANRFNFWIGVTSGIFAVSAMIIFSMWINGLI